MRKEFGKILNSTNHHAKSHPNQIEFGAPDKGDLRVPFPLPEPVLAEIDFYQHTIPGKFQTYLNRSPRYMPYLRKEFEKAGLPPDLAWLALVESGFNPKVTSPAGAGGLWQFMKATGSRYGLRQDNYVDERNNWRSATRAAIGYLKDLRDQFHGDWALALSAYNMGEGGLQRAIDSNGGDLNFWTLIKTPPASDRIRLETKRYYPLFLAAMIISSSPERYGFTVAPQPVEETAAVRVKGMYALADLDKAMGYAPGTLSQINPELIKEVTPPTGEYRVSVPVQDQEKFASAKRYAADGTVRQVSGAQGRYPGQSRPAIRHGCPGVGAMQQIAAGQFHPEGADAPGSERQRGPGRRGFRGFRGYQEESAG